MLDVIEGEAPQPKDFCAVCDTPFCTSWTLVGGKPLFSCSDECAEMLQRWQRVTGYPATLSSPNTESRDADRRSL